MDLGHNQLEIASTGQGYICLKAKLGPELRATSPHGASDIALWSDWRTLLEYSAYGARL